MLTLLTIQIGLGAAAVGYLLWYVSGNGGTHKANHNSGHDENYDRNNDDLI